MKCMSYRNTTKGVDGVLWLGFLDGYLEYRIVKRAKYELQKKTNGNWHTEGEYENIYQCKEGVEYLPIDWK
jgi:hypothetical protein